MPAAPAPSTHTSRRAARFGNDDDEVEDDEVDEDEDEEDEGEPGPLSDEAGSDARERDKRQRRTIKTKKEEGGECGMVSDNVEKKEH